MQKLFSVFFICVLCFVSCKTIPSSPVVEKEEVKEEVVQKKSEEVPIKAEEPAPVEVKVEEAKEPESEVIAEFGDVKITKKDYNDTMNEVKIVVEGLNKTTATGDYKQWLTYLSESYKKEYSKASTLQATVDSLKRKNVKGLKLESLKDYFTYVFVASRQNIKVDDIEFLSPVRVNVLMVKSGKKLLVYDLEKIDNRWLLVPHS